MALSSETVVRVLMSHRNRLSAYIWSIVGDAHLAEDVFQEVSMLAIRKGCEVADSDRLVVWLRRTARLKSLEACRKQRRSPLIDDSLLAEYDADWQRYDPLEEAELLEALHACLAGLTENNRRIVALRYGQGLKSSEVANSLQRTVAAVYRAIGRIHRAVADCMDRKLGREQDLGRS